MKTWFIMAAFSNGEYRVLGQVCGEEDWALAYAQRKFGKNVWIEEDFC